MFYKASLKVSLYSEFKTLSKSDKTSISQIIEKLKSDLKENDFHGSYFDRGAETEARICDERWVYCIYIVMSRVIIIFYPDYLAESSAAKADTTRFVVSTSITPSTPTRATRPGSSSPRGTSTTSWRDPGLWFLLWSRLFREEGELRKSTGNISTACCSAESI